MFIKTCTLYLAHIRVNFFKHLSFLCGENFQDPFFNFFKYTVLSSFSHPTMQYLGEYLYRLINSFTHPLTNKSGSYCILKNMEGIKNTQNKTHSTVLQGNFYGWVWKDERGEINLVTLSWHPEQPGQWQVFFHRRPYEQSHGGILERA
jgi:hypothetical protein